jgi:phosphoglycerate dehydrogenase-like enzyme
MPLGIRFLGEEVGSVRRLTREWTAWVTRAWILRRTCVPSMFERMQQDARIARGAILLGLNPSIVTQEDIARIAEIAPGREILVGADADRAASSRERIEIAGGWVAPDRLLALPSLRWFQQWFAGAEWLVDRPEAAERDFLLTNASGVSSAVVVEQAFGYVLALTRRLRDAWEAQRDRVWHKPPVDRFAELAGKTLVVAGLGAIGSRMARVARGFDMRVFGVRRRPELPCDEVERVAGPDQLASLVAEADVVMSALPYTRETRHLFSAAVFARVKPGAIFVSVGRGNVVDEQALIAALAGGHLAGAGLDVFEREPLPAGSPLWTLETAMVTPHWGAAFPHRFERTMALFLDNLRRYVAGEPLRNLVDKRRGY